MLGCRLGVDGGGVCVIYSKSRLGVDGDASGTEESNGGPPPLLSVYTPVYRDIIN